MAKPRVFVSSTYYDLKHIRKSIESFVRDIGYEPVLFENGDIAFDHHEPLDESCYKELESCHILVLVIGGRYGAGISDENITLSNDELEKHYQHFNSITKKEYEAAKERDIPIYIFVEKGVAAEYQTYKENADNDTIKYVHVDSVNVFRLIDTIYSQKRNNLIREFENVDDITRWLREQWAGLFTQFLINKTNNKPIASLEKQLANLSVVTETLKDYSENIIRGLSPDQSEQIISSIGEKEKQRTELSEFLQNSNIRHLVRDHDVNSDLLYDAFVSSLDFQSFQTHVNELFPKGQHCYMLEEDEELQDEFVKLREKLNISNWRSIEKIAK